MACRGTGKIISNLGGSPTTVTCPWCRGGGVRLADADAQSPWAEGEQSGAEPPQDPEPSGGEAA